MADFARGQRFVELRERAHLSQEEAAHEIGVSTKTVRSWEHGGKIRWANAKKVGTFYGVDPEPLVSREEPSETEREVPDLADPHAEQLDRIEKKLDEILEEIKPEKVTDSETASSEDVPVSLPPEPDRQQDAPSDGEQQKRQGE